MPLKRKALILSVVAGEAGLLVDGLGSGKLHAVSAIGLPSGQTRMEEWRRNSLFIFVGPWLVGDIPGCELA